METKRRMSATPDAYSAFSRRPEKPLHLPSLTWAHLARDADLP
jgi:hypothetical protein